MAQMMTQPTNIGIPGLQGGTPLVNGQVPKSNVSISHASNPLVQAFHAAKNTIKDVKVGVVKKFNNVQDFMKSNNGPFNYGGGHDNVPGLVLEKAQAQTVATPTPEIKSISGTNYDPYDPAQNDPNRKKEDIGKGATSIFITEDMVAVPRKRLGSNEPMLPYGTIIYVPELKKKFLVADTMSNDYVGQNKIDFPTPHKGKNIDSKYNKDFTYQIIEMGKTIDPSPGVVGDWGHADARKKAKDLSWK